MLVSKLIFTITILDIRNAKHIVHSTRFWLNVNGVIKADVLEISAEDFHNEKSGTWSDMQTKSVADFLNGKDGSWEDLLKQSVDDTVRNMFRELIRMKELTDIPDDFIDLGEIFCKWKQNNILVEIPGGVAGIPLADLIERFKLNLRCKTVLRVESSFTVE